MKNNDGFSQASLLSGTSVWFLHSVLTLSASPSFLPSFTLLPLKAAPCHLAGVPCVPVCHRSGPGMVQREAKWTGMRVRSSVLPMKDRALACGIWLEETCKRASLSPSSAGASVAGPQYWTDKESCLLVVWLHLALLQPLRTTMVSCSGVHDLHPEDPDIDSKWSKKRRERAGSHEYTAQNNAQEQQLDWNAF